MWFIVDKEDIQKVKERAWSLSVYGYVTSSWNKKTHRTENVRLHRFVLGMKKSDKRQVDHINRNKLDNRKSNLRICTASENNAHMALTKKNTSGHKGIYWTKYPQDRQWNARISFNKKRIYIGAFATKEEASRAYNEAAKKYHGTFAHLNVVI